MALDPVAMRRDFPYLDQRLYLNTASTGIGRLGSGQDVARFFEKMYSRGYDGAAEWRAIAGAVRARVARLAHVKADDVGFAASTTEALNLIAHSLPVTRGDRVVLMADEFPSVRAAADILAARGATLVELQAVDEMTRTTVLADAASGARYVLASHVHWETGTKIDLAALKTACGAGALLVVDGIQALGGTDVDAGHADAYVASVFKWLISGFGLAIAITSPALREVLEPVFRGYANPAPSRALAYSHANYPGLATLDGSLAYMEEIGWAAIFARNRELVARLREKLTGFDIATPPGAAGSILSLRLPDPAAVAMRLSQAGASVEARGAHLRVSPHFYNDETDIDRFAELMLQTTRGN